MAQHHTGRRHLFGASAAMLLLGTAGAGPSKAAELDGDLLAACAHFVHLEAEYGRLCQATDWLGDPPMTPGMTALEAEFERVGNERHELGDWLAEQTPRTAEGAQARARAAVAYLRGDIRHDMISRLQYAIVCHVAGEG